MSRAAVTTTAPSLPNVSTTALTPGYQAYEILHVGFAVLPIVAGLDKFLHFRPSQHEVVPTRSVSG